jgi:hypothetical protein
MVTACNAVHVALAPEPLWLGSISTCALHVSRCEWSCALGSRPPYARSRYENVDGDAMLGYKTETSGWAPSSLYVVKKQAIGAGEATQWQRWCSARRATMSM